MYATDYFENKMLGLLNGQTIQTPKTEGVPKVYLAMFMSDPGDTGDEGYEVSYTGYGRQEITFSNPSEYGTGLAIENINQINFAESPINIGNVTHIGVMDSLSGGNMLLYGQLDTALNIQQGVTPIFRAGAVKWIWTGNLGRYYREKIMNVFRGFDCEGFDPYIGFCNGDPQGAGSEFSGYGYQRIPLIMSVPAQQPNGTAMCQNATELISNEATGNWGTMSYVCIYDQEANGQLYAVIPLQTSFVVSAQTSVGFHIGSLRFSVN